MACAEWACGWCHWFASNNETVMRCPNCDWDRLLSFSDEEEFDVVEDSDSLVDDDE